MMLITGMNSDFRIEHDDDMLIVRSKNGAMIRTGLFWIGVGLFGVVLIPLSIGQHIPPGPDHGLSSTVLALAFLAILTAAAFAGGVFLMSRRVFTTAFDLRSREVVYSRSVGGRRPKTERCAFEELAGGGIDQDAQTGACSPYIKLLARDRRLTLLPTAGIDVSAGEELVGTICAATGLPYLGRKAWRGLVLRIGGGDWV